jgi:hypothetical protein
MQLDLLARPQETEFHDWIPMNYPAGFLLLQPLSGRPSVFVDGDVDGTTALRVRVAPHAHR